MNAPESPGGDLVPRSEAELTADRPRLPALVPGTAIVASGSSLPRSAAASTSLGIPVVVVVQAVLYKIQVSSVAEWVFPTVAFGMLGAFGLGLLVWLGRRKWGNRLDRRTPMLGPAPARGHPVRVVGVVQNHPPLLETPEHRPVVLARYQGCRGTRHSPGSFRRWRWELHAVDFTVLADDGREIWIDSRHVRLLPHPPRTSPSAIGLRRPLYLHPADDPDQSTSWIYDQDTIAPGDRIELHGTLDLVPHPSAPAGSDRQARLVPVLRGTPRRPIRILRYFAGVPEPV